ncbi:hypothetical protein PRUPE_8G073200 [Prunus persica]|uniref:Uncharacterized protein n=1 Tax=Prunus persica TaxID=3760 RepID=A0A251MUJ8_PRUPE|nr:hypothetical protein PRUPE_8G073200 [Prunus persica]
MRAHTMQTPFPCPNETPTLCTSTTDQNRNCNPQTETVELFQPKLALNSGCLGLLFWGDDKESDGEQLS